MFTILLWDSILTNQESLKLKRLEHQKDIVHWQGLNTQHVYRAWSGCSKNSINLNKPNCVTKVNNGLDMEVMQEGR